MISQEDKRGQFTVNRSLSLFFRPETPFDFPDVREHPHTVSQKVDFGFPVAQDFYGKLRDCVSGTHGAEQNLNVKRPAIRAILCK